MSEALSVRPEEREHEPPPRTERTHVNVRAIGYTAAGLATMLVIAAFLARWVFDGAHSRETAAELGQFPLKAEERDKLPPEPRLEQIDRMEGKATSLYAAEQRRLETYSWVDKDAGIVRIPVDRAMKLMIEQKRLAARPK